MEGDSDFIKQNELLTEKLSKDYEKENDCLVKRGLASLSTCSYLEKEVYKK